MSTDFHGFAFYNDFIAEGQVMESGTALLPLSHTDVWDPASRTWRLIRAAVAWKSLVNFMGRYGDNGTLLALPFVPIPDQKLVFSNYTESIYQGIGGKGHRDHWAQLISQGTALVPYSEKGVNQTLADLAAFPGPAHAAFALRTQLGLRTYCYQHTGNFSNLSPLPWLGSYHSPDLPMFCGTYDDFSEMSENSSPTPAN